jgi:hypothetical protein
MIVVFTRHKGWVRQLKRIEPPPETAVKLSFGFVPVRRLRLVHVSGAVDDTAGTHPGRIPEAADRPASTLITAGPSPGAATKTPSSPKRTITKIKEIVNPQCRLLTSTRVTQNRH